MALPFSGPSSVTNYAGQDCGQLIQQFSKTISQFVNREIRNNKQEEKRTQKDFEARKAGGFWDKITAGPLSQFQKKVEGAVSDAKDMADGGGGLLGKYSAYMDLGQQYSSMATTMISGVVSSVVDEVGVVGQLTDAVGIGSLLPTAQGAGCDRNLLAATMGTVTRIAGKAVDAGLQSVFNVQATLGLSLEAVPDLYAGLMSLPVGSLTVLLTSRESLLDRISSTAEAALELAQDIEDSDYPFDHRAFVLAAKASLEEADGDLATVESTLEAGGRFLETNWERARTTIDETGDELLGGPGLGLTIGQIKLIKLVGYQKLLKSLIDILQQRQEVYAQIIGAMGSFSTTFASSANFKNLAAPIVQQVRCTLQQIIEDMTKTTDINAALRYVIKEKQWGLELVQLAVFMEATGSLGTPFSIPSTELNDAATGLSESIKGSEDQFSSSEEYSGIIVQISSFIKELNRKIIRNVSTTVLEGLTTAIVRNVEIMKGNDNDLSELLSGFTSGFAGAALDVIQGVQSVVNFMEEQGLDNLVDNLMNGEIEDFFSADSLKNQLETMARQSIGEIAQCCADNAGDGDTEARLLKMNRVMLAFQRGKDLYDDYVGKYAENYIKDLSNTITPRLMEIRQDVNRVSKSRCVNKGIPGVSIDLPTSGLILS